MKVALAAFLVIGTADLNVASAASTIRVRMEIAHQVFERVGASAGVYAVYHVPATWTAGISPFEDVVALLACMKGGDCSVVRVVPKALFHRKDGDVFLMGRVVYMDDKTGTTAVMFEGFPTVMPRSKASRFMSKAHTTLLVQARYVGTPDGRWALSSVKLVGSEHREPIRWK